MPKEPLPGGQKVTVPAGSGSDVSHPWSGLGQVPLPLGASVSPLCQKGGGALLAPTLFISESSCGGSLRSVLGAPGSAPSPGRKEHFVGRGGL